VFVKCRNGVIPSAKLASALDAEQATQGSKPGPTGFMLTGIYSMQGSAVVGAYIRCLASKYRELSLSTEKQRVCYSKA